MGTTDKTSLGDRMKEKYEQPTRYLLPGRMPIILRLDGKSFHTFTRGMIKPFDTTLMHNIDMAALEVCQEAQGAQIAYVQSDEISILIHSYKKLRSQCWFDGEVQKMTSIAASVASSYMSRAYNKQVLFDARVFVLPEAEVCNAFIWRQQDATRNSIQMLTRSLFSHNQVDGKDQSEMQEMCFSKGANWNDLPTQMKRGRCLNRLTGRWVVDKEPPIFTQDRSYIERHLEVEPEEE